MADSKSDRAPLLAEEGSIRQRKLTESRAEEHNTKFPISYNPKLPYGGRVYLARRKIPDPWWVTTLEVLAVLFCVVFAYYAYYHFEHLHFNVAKGYAHLGYATAQHQVGQKYLKGIGVEKDEHVAMDWFKKAADQGHPHASYNLAVGHMKGIRTDLLKRGEVHHMIQHAAKNGVKKAGRVLHEVCTNGGCD